MPIQLSGWAITGIVSVVIAIVAALADVRRSRRKNVDQVGFMPWPMILMLSLLLAAVAIGLAIKGL